MERKECYHPEDCQANHLGCSCKPEKVERGQPSAVKRMLIAAAVLLFAIGVWAAIVYIVVKFK